MKTQKFFCLFAGVLISALAFSQDSSHLRNYSQDRTYEPASGNSDNAITQPHIYRDTRLGSSSPLYNTYKKNDYGAGAITTNPHKSGSVYEPENPAVPPKLTPHIYRDTRLGSSSPLYNTYEKNDYGAGSITTNPNKGSSAGGVPAEVYQPAVEPSDSVQNNHNSMTQENNH